MRPRQADEKSMRSPIIDHHDSRAGRNRQRGAAGRAAGLGGRRAYVDDDVSAYGGRERPDRRMLDDYGAGSWTRWWSGTLTGCIGSRVSWRSSSTSVRRLGCRSWPRSAAMWIYRRTTGSSWLVSSGLWRGRRAMTRAAGSGASTRSLSRPGRSRAAAHGPTGTRRTSARCVNPRPL